MEINRFRDADAMAEAAAGRVAAAARRAAAERGRFTLVLAGGRTPEGLYLRLAADPWRARVPWEAVHVFWGDERLVPPEDPASNFGRARGLFLSRVPIPPGNVHPVPFDPDPARAAAAYEARLRAFFKPEGGGLPAFDLVLLGLGPDGHTASLFPGAPPAPPGRWAAAVPAPDAEPRLPRVTLTFPVLNRAREVCVLAAGPEKAALVGEILDDPAAARRYPAAMLRPEGRLAWYVAAG
ncbi:6-phosphogluconolactonase [Dissulfurirhabdus thermomarina]|uniref:6-phosphogluconolactonase n=1 Tax=Dissulfurirhabdus thermomarina TaxID=1765737 RepID=A0A6N9TK93_DISTH|nr:6-phosphogluconolactonase [Dissulfurirhabdus thermomarina]NDY41498.1 6-phosphogluconolactonase [Dissulfurirhabdus thermomarina]NMX23875.1 6-phosphogluconolactonase [Dissulfurirhabdus thermomarina]